MFEAVTERVGDDCISAGLGTVVSTDETSWPGPGRRKIGVIWQRFTC
jgi:hypothetical protein